LRDAAALRERSRELLESHLAAALDDRDRLQSFERKRSL
jgi:hypothetical protein